MCDTYTSGTGGHLDAQTHDAHIHYIIACDARICVTSCAGS